MLNLVLFNTEVAGAGVVLLLEDICVILKRFFEGLQLSLKLAIFGLEFLFLLPEFDPVFVNLVVERGLLKRVLLDLLGQGLIEGPNLFAQLDFVVFLDLQRFVAGPLISLLMLPYPSGDSRLFSPIAFFQRRAPRNSCA